jgi:hypothetical protein
MAFLLPKLNTPSCKSLPSPLPKPQFALPIHAGGKLHGSGPAQAAAPGHLSLLLLLSASQQEAATAVPPSKSTETRKGQIFISTSGRQCARCATTCPSCSSGNPTMISTGRVAFLHSCLYFG